MFSRRQWLAATVAFGAGFFSAPGWALAGLFGSRRGGSPCPCPPAPPSVDPAGAARFSIASVSITTPPRKSTVGPDTTTKAASGTASSSYYGPAYVKCYIDYPDGTRYSATPPVATADQFGRWSVTFPDAPATPTNQFAELHAEMYGNESASGQYADADLILIKIL